MPNVSLTPQVLAWLTLFAAGLFEVAWAVGLKKSDGLRHFGWAAFTGLALVASMALLARALRDLPLGTAYAAWVGIGILGTTVFGALAFGEPMGWAKAFFALLLVIGVVGLKFA